MARSATFQILSGVQRDGIWVDLAFVNPTSGSPINYYKFATSSDPNFAPAATFTYNGSLLSSATTSLAAHPRCTDRYIRIAAGNLSLGVGPWSNTVTFVPPAGTCYNPCSSAPGQPTVTVAPQGGCGINASWSIPQPAGQMCYCEVSEYTKYENGALYGTSTTGAQTVYGGVMKAGVRYEYTVRCKNGYGWGPMSAKVGIIGPTGCN